MAISVELPVEGPCPMTPFIYVPADVMSEMAVVDSERESSCKCYGQDCALNRDACECLKKNGSECAYTGDGRLQNIDDAVLGVLSFTLCTYCTYYMLDILLILPFVFHVFFLKTVQGIRVQML